MSKIRILPEALANKIAAGEVVERPASVVKELLENAIDAGARSLEIEVEAGGKRLIRIRDDGEGMTSDDALLAFERHATSKLRSAEDLLDISTLGFRGEALPSIASVSRLLLETRHESNPVGTSVEINGAKVASVKEMARAPGTAVTVRDLFFNIPARKKFLKSESTELGHIVTVFTQYALAHPEARFTLKSSSSELFDFHPVSNLRERVFQVFGGDLLGQLIEIHSDVPIFIQDDDEAGSPAGRQEWVRLHGFVSKPDVHKLNRNSLYFFVNRRMVRDRILLHALSEAYRNILPSGIFPAVLVFLEVPCREVDVNVHPSKTEVRFRRQALIHDCLRDAIRRALMEARPQAPFAIRRGAIAGLESESPFDSPVVESLNLESSAHSTEPATQTAASTSQGQMTQKPASFEQHPPAGGPDLLRLTPPAPPPASGKLPFQYEASLEVAASHPALSAVSPAPVMPAQAWSGTTPAAEHDIVPLGQVDNSFIVAEDRGALLIIDQHVAHERVLFEKVLGQRNKGEVESQRLLLPIIVELTPRQQVILENITPELNGCGFEVEPFGRRTIAVKAAPADLTTADIQHLVGELLESLEKETQAINLVRLREKIAASIACHAAIKVNTPLERSKMIWLINELMKTQFPMSCPHGRPVILRYEKNEILRAFKRI